jgi:hypothetical protein
MKTSLNTQEDLFKSVYLYTFGYTEEEGKKGIPVDFATALWPILMKDKCKFLDDWLAFIEKSKV